MVILEIRKNISRPQFQIILALLVSAVLIDFYLTCSFYEGKHLSEIPSAYWAFVGKSFFSTIGNLPFKSFLFFLISTMLAADMFYDEIDNGMHNMFFSRKEKARVIFSKAVAIFITNFLVIVMVLVISQILALSAFPVQGNLTSVITYNELMTADPNRIFSYFENYYPYLNNLLYIAQMGVISGVTGVFSFSLTFINEIKKYTLLLLPMIIYISYSLGTSVIASKVENDRLSIIVETGLLNANSYGHIGVIILYLLTELSISYALIRKGIRDEEKWL